MRIKVGAVMMAATLVAVGVQAESFGTGANRFSIDFVDIGYAGNAGETHDYGIYGGLRTFGAVDYNYRIGKLEVTVDQFAKARFADSRIGDGDEGYWNDGTRTVGTGGPVSYVSWFEAAKFANWLTTGDAYSGAYQFDDSGTLMTVNRDAAVSAYDMVYVLPTEDEWYKAAYYKPVNDGSYSLYASGLDSVPIWGTTDGWNYFDDVSGRGFLLDDSPNHMWETGFGGKEQNGTYDMMGNIWEWNENTGDSITEERILRGGPHSGGVNYMRSSTRGDTDPAYNSNHVGFRVTVIPEPSVIALVGVFGGGLWFIRRYFPLI